jgi:hypothetical protein
MTDEQQQKFEQDAAAYAAACIGSIREMLDKLHHAAQCDGEEIDGEACEHKDDDEYHNEEQARQAIDDDPLSVEIRSDWYTPGSTPEPGEFNILLTTGGPAARLIGDLDDLRQPARVRFQYQDWFKPWTDVVVTGDDYQALLEYAQHFYYGE